jgi:hypothetical protein
MPKHYYDDEVGCSVGFEPEIVGFGPQIVGAHLVDAENGSWDALVGYDVFEDPATQASIHAAAGVAAAFPPFGTLAAGIIEGANAIGGEIHRASVGPNPAAVAKTSGAKRAAIERAARAKRHAAKNKMAELLLKAKSGDKVAQLTLIGIDVMRDPDMLKAKLAMRHLQQGKIPLPEELLNAKMLKKMNANYHDFFREALALAKSKGLDKMPPPPHVLPKAHVKAAAIAAGKREAAKHLARAHKTPMSTGVLVLNNGRLAAGRFARV